MITNNKTYFSRRIAIDKLCDAKTPKQVKAVMRKACALCQEAGKYNRKGVAQRLLTNAAKRVVAYSQELAIDDASVFVELGDYESAYRVLKRNGLDNEAEALKKAIKGGD